MSALVHEKVWVDKNVYNDAERAYYESLSKKQATSIGSSSLASEVAKARQHIKNSLECLPSAIGDVNNAVCKWSQSFGISVNPIKSQVVVIGGPDIMDGVAALAGVPTTEINNKLNILEKENFELKQVVDDLRKMVVSLQARVESIESANSGNKAEAPKAPVPQAQEDSDDGVDLFGSDDEEESAEAAKIREERLAAYNAKKSKKPVLIAKSNIILDVKPWDDETDMKAVEDAVRSINNEGLLWGAAKLVPLAFGIKKLQISSVVEDEKISVDWLIEEIEKFEDLVQSVDIAAFNKV